MLLTPACPQSSCPIPPEETPSRRGRSPGPGAWVATAVIFLAGIASGFGATVNISVINNDFNPRNPTINQGDTVVWTWNSGGATHSVTSGPCTFSSCPAAGDGLFDSGIHSSPHSFMHTFNTVGPFPYFCRVHGASMTGSITVQAPDPLICNPMADNPVGNPPLTVQFMANPGGGTPPYTFQWDFADGTAVDPNENPQHTFNALGTYDVQVTVTDNAAVMKTCMTPIIVTDLTCSATADPNSGDAPLDVTLTGSASGGDPNYTFMWDLGDGSPMGMGQVVMHSYSTPGLKHLMLMVEDSLAVPCAAPLLVNVTDPNCVAGDNDADGICDDTDNCGAVSNPSQADFDADGVGDACDDCVAVADPTQVDTDMDGKGDACDLTITGPTDGAIITDCNTSPTITWTPDIFDRFRVFIAWDPGFIKGTFVTSGDTLLKTTFFTPSHKKWRKACTNALAAGQGLFFKVFGKNRTTKATGFSNVVYVDVF